MTKSDLNLNFGISKYVKTLKSLVLLGKMEILKKHQKNDRRESILRRFILKVIYVYTWKIAKNKAFRRFY